MSENLTKRERKARIRRGEPIEALGLQFYPITMTYYEEFLTSKGVWALRQTSLAKQSFEYVSMPFLAALWAMKLCVESQFYPLRFYIHFYYLYICIT